MQNQQQGRYSLFTAITMIVGICIGSGIFFKADNVLAATGGSIFLGVVLFILGAIAIIFGGLTIATLAARTDKIGGIITYSEEFVGKGHATTLGWFQTLMYYPTLVAVVSFVVGIYMCTLFGWDGGLATWCLIGTGFLILCYIYNLLSPKFGGFVQDATCIIKVIPLIGLGICGMIWGDPAAGFANISEQISTSGKWMMGISAVAFSYDGWVVSTSISHEIRDAKKNLPRALIIAPLIILGLYLTFFIAISSYMGSDAIITLGDDAIYTMVIDLFGPFFAKLVLVAIICSVIGTVNGLVLGSIRMPYAMSQREKFFPGRDWFAKTSGKNDMPINGGIFMLVLCLFWMAVHYFTASNGFLGGSDVSEISITANYLLYLGFYWMVFRLWRKGELTSVFRGLVCPLMASIGVGLILFGSLSGGWIYVVYLLVSGIVMAIGLGYYYKQKKTA